MAVFEINWTFSTLELCRKPQHIVFIVNKNCMY